MKKIFRSLVAIVVLGGIIYLATNYAGQFQEQVGVKGASTKRDQGIAQNITNDIGTQVNSAKAQAMHINLSDVTNYLSRFKRVPQDANDIKNYVGKQVSSFTSKKKK